MTGQEIMIIVIGVIFLFASFILDRGKGKTEHLDVDQEIRKIKEAAVYQEGEVRRKLDALLTQASEEVLADAEDKLAKISNDKLMAVDEFSNQVLEKIENNNQEVIFLYDMLQKKEDEMKSTMNKMEQTRRENKELFDRLEELKQAKARVNSRNAAKKSAAARPGEAVAGAGQASGIDGTQEKIPRRQEEPVLPAGPEEGSAEETEPEPEDMLEKQEKVLALYAEEKSIKEISKMLSMGQGAVKLIIDLYGKK